MQIYLELVLCLFATWNSVTLMLMSGYKGAIVEQTLIWLRDGKGMSTASRCTNELPTICPGIKKVSFQIASTMILTRFRHFTLFPPQTTLCAHGEAGGLSCRRVTHNQIYSYNIGNQRHYYTVTHHLKRSGSYTLSHRI